MHRGAADGTGLPSGGGGGGTTALRLKVVTVHTAGSTIVADMTGATYDDYEAIIIEDNLVAAAITTTDGALIYLANVQLSALRTFTANLSATPTTGTVSLHLTFADTASI